MNEPSRESPKTLVADLETLQKELEAVFLRVKKETTAAERAEPQRPAMVYRGK